MCKYKLKSRKYTALSVKSLYMYRFESRRYSIFVMARLLDFMCYQKDASVLPFEIPRSDIILF